MISHLPMPTYKVEGYSLYKQAKGWFEIITNGDFCKGTWIGGSTSSCWSSYPGSLAKIPVSYDLEPSLCLLIERVLMFININTRASSASPPVWATATCASGGHPVIDEVAIHRHPASCNIGDSLSGQLTVLRWGLVCTL